MKRRRIIWYKSNISADLLGVAFATFLVIISTLGCTPNRGSLPFGSSDRIATSSNPLTATTVLSNLSITTAPSTSPSNATTKDSNVPFTYSPDVINSSKQDYSLSSALGNMGNSGPQELANSANAAIYSSFASNENGSTMYPSDFGGVYFANGKLIVCITQEQNRDNYQSLMNASQKSIVIYKVVKHSFNDLMQLAKELAVQEDAFITYGVDVMNNRAEVFLPNEAKVKSNNLSNSNSKIPVVYKYMQYLK